jgi:Helix-turn-helix domain of resolvase
MAPRPIPISDRIMQKVEMDPNSGCWLWCACLTSTGYGKIGRSKKEGPGLAHRESYRCFVGDLSEEDCVLHRCDTPACVNPNHLFLGSRSDNASDMVGKGRQYRGSRHWSAKIDESDVENIRSFYSNGSKVEDLAKAFDISESSIYRITSGAGWRQ